GAWPMAGNRMASPPRLRVLRSRPHRSYPCSNGKPSHDGERRRGMCPNRLQEADPLDQQERHCRKEEASGMTCTRCGAQLPDDANFCLKCGQAQDVAEEMRSIQKELCELHITFKRVLWTYRYTITVIVTGRNGRQQIREISNVRDRRDEI